MTENLYEGTTKFYSMKAISIATFFGGPLAAGILVLRNFIQLGKEDFAKHSLFIGIISTVLLFVGLFSIPEQIIDKIPNSIIPAIYTGIIYLIVNKFQGKELKIHKENNGQFFSGWKAAGVGAVCLLIISAGIFTYVYTLPDDFDNAQYNIGIADFTKNEETALQLYSLLETADIQDVVTFIRYTGIPAWQNNLQILDKLDRIEGLYKEYINQNQLLREYCKLRIESYQMLSKMISEDTNSYDLEFEEINKKIDEVLEKLN